MRDDKNLNNNRNSRGANTAGANKVDSYKTGANKVDSYKAGAYKAGANTTNAKPIQKTALPVKRRLLFLLTIMLCAFAAIALRIAQIQFIEGNSLSEQASINQSRSVDISPRRGAILDRNGDELAINTIVETISIIPDTLRTSISRVKSLNLDIVADDLAYLLDLDPAFTHEKLNKETKYEVLKRKVEPEIADTIREYIAAYSLKGLDLTIDSKRFYLNDNLASHVIGITTDDNQGLTGIEASMEKFIKGTPGMIKGELDARRAEVPLSAENRVAVQDGLNVVLTIDTAIQFFATSALERAIADNDVTRGGVILIMDPRNGDILAMVSKPDFNLNDPYAAPPGYIEETWNGHSQAGADILNKTVWRNKAIMDTYEPGSTFKPFTVAAGLEEGVISLESQFKCEPITGYYTNPIGCWITGSHGTLDLAHAVMQSCNPALMRISQRVTRDRFYEYIREFGFYERTGIPLPGESVGIFQQNPRDVDMLVASFGQRFTITPIELITAYSALANGGSLMKPRLVKELRDDDGNVITRYDPEVVRKVVSKETCDLLRVMLEDVVNEGTGKNAYVSGYRVAGKTGTSQTTEEDRKIASFCAFAPSDNPVISVLVMLDDPKGESYMGGAIAAPVAQKLVEEVLTYLEVERRYSERDLKEQVQQVVIPDLAGMTVEEAVKELQDLGFEYKLQAGISDTDLPVLVQAPPPLTKVSAKPTVVIYVDEDAEPFMVSAPDFRNKSTYEASELARRAGLNIRASGSGIAKGQSVYAGDEVEAGTVIDISFRYTDNIE